MKIVITGGTGLLGQELTARFRARGDADVRPLSLHEFDVSDEPAVRRAVAEINPDVLINCAAIVPVEECETDPERAYAVNRDGAVFLMMALAALPTPAIFVQISSSVVFGGWEDGTFRIEGYTESDERRPNNVYERSKKEAEDLISSIAAQRSAGIKRWYIARASVLYGQGRRTFVDEFAEAISSGREIAIVPDRWSSLTWTRDFAAGLDALINEEQPSGLYHLANTVQPGEATMTDIAEEIGAHFGLAPQDVKHALVPRKQFFKIPRAPSNVLLNTKLPKLRYWKEALREYLQGYEILNPNIEIRNKSQ